jgi:hypothetical protein
MHSSTSHSRPRLALKLALVALLAWAGSVAYSLRVNPEVRFFRAALDAKHAWASRIDAQRTNKTVFFGGSSCGTSIDPERLLARHGLPAVNYGFGAGMGATVLARCALSATRQGDTLVVALEPGLLSDTAEVPSLGAQFSAAAGHLEWVKSFPGQPEQPPARGVVNLRPGGRHTFTLLGKLIQGKPLYRYSVREIHPGGWHEVLARGPISPVTAPDEISPDGRALLRALRHWGETNRVRVLCSLPLNFCPDSMRDDQARARARWLITVTEFLPVLRDPDFGLNNRIEWFADMHLHPTREGAAHRTDSVAAQLKSGATWSREELQRLAAP